MNDTIEKVLREYIDFVNGQVGVYMDALAGFEGHYTRVERQVFRENRPQSTGIDEKGMPEIVWASYEDPTKPDIIHNRIMRTVDYLEANSKGGPNEGQYCQAILVFLFTFWEEEIRPRLAALRNVNVREIKSDIMGDLRVLRNTILHSKGILGTENFKKLKKVSDMFVKNEAVHVPYEHMHKIFVLIKQDCARMLFEWLGIPNPEVKPEEIKDFAIQFIGQRRKVT